MRLQLQRIDVDLNLAIACRHRAAAPMRRDIGDLVAHLELRQVLELRLVQALAFERDQADRLAGSVMPSTTGGSVPGGNRRRSAIARLEMLLSAALGRCPAESKS